MMERRYSPYKQSKENVIRHGMNMLKEKLEEIEAFNTSSMCAALRPFKHKKRHKKRKRARCFICKKRGHVLWKCPDKKNKHKGETSKAVVDKELNARIKNHMSPVKSLFKRLKHGLKMLDMEEDERKFIFSYGVGEATVETKEGRDKAVDDGDMNEEADVEKFTFVLTGEWKVKAASKKYGYTLGEPSMYERKTDKLVGHDNFDTNAISDKPVVVELWLVDTGVLPIENFVDGSMHRTYDLLLCHKLHINSLTKSGERTVEQAVL
ncbi:ARID DNA-binding domain-containing protein [Tanacetum coccineum]|uniref:ARID DNA-binding domain-containing protein n=1 Tax=Tanacetum coccineum TaxID=301880 RepID=A0ABQ5FDC5_9ASTR